MKLAKSTSILGPVIPPFNNLWTLIAFLDLGSKNI